jgi:DnaA-homolog protein
MEWQVGMLQQNFLNVGLRDDATFANFYIGTNSESLIHLTAAANCKGESYIYIWGKVGSGCTHLLQACCNAAQQQKIPAIYLTLNLPNLIFDVLEDLDAMELICIDDINSVMGDLRWEEALFNLFNKLAEAKKHLIIAADCLPAMLACKLPDLKSRLSSGVAFQVEALTDDEKILALQIRAKNRGLNLAENVIQYLLTHLTRDMHTLVKLLDKLDRASLVKQRKLTIPFVKEILTESKIAC